MNCFWKLWRVDVQWRSGATCSLTHGYSSWWKGTKQPLDVSDDVRRKVAPQKSTMWTSFSAPPSSLTLFVSPSPPPLSLSEPQSALYKTSLHTDAQMYKHLASLHSASQPLIQDHPRKHVLPADIWPSWMSLRRFISALSHQDRSPHSLFLLKLGSWYRLSRRSVCFLFWFLCAAAKIKDSLTWGQTWRPHVCGPPLCCCCCQSSLWWVKRHFDFTFVLILILFYISTISVINVALVW